VDLSPLLTDQDASGVDRLAGKPLDTVSLTGTVSAIPRTPACFFMCHLFFSLQSILGLSK
jgi:hypothetical protein